MQTRGLEPLRQPVLDALSGARPIRYLQNLVHLTGIKPVYVWLQIQLAISIQRKNLVHHVGFEPTQENLDDHSRLKQTTLRYIL